MASAGEQSRATVLSACFSLLLCNFGSWQGEIVPAGVYAPRKDRRLRRLTMRNHLCKPEVSPGGCNGERRQAAALSACKKLRCVGSVRVWRRHVQNHNGRWPCARQGYPRHCRTMPKSLREPHLRADGYRDELMRAVVLRLCVFHVVREWQLVLHAIASAGGRVRSQVHRMCRLTSPRRNTPDTSLCWVGCMSLLFVSGSRRFFFHCSCSQIAKSSTYAYFTHHTAHTLAYSHCPSSSLLGGSHARI